MIMLQENILRQIEEASGDNPAGFSVFHDTEQDKYYGYYLGEHSKVELLTKAYATERNCNNALERFRNGQFLADVKEGAGGYYVEFKSESGKVMAWSPEFAKRTRAENVARPGVGEKQVEEAKIEAEAAEPTSESTPPRHSFRLDFYRGEHKAPVRGRIEYSLTQESAAFQGLDMDFVRSFVARYLKKSEEQEGATRPETGRISIWENGKPAEGDVFSTERSLEVSLDVDIPDGVAYNAFIYIKSLSDNRESLIGRKQGAGAPVRVPVFTAGLPQGLYRFTATVHLEGNAPEKKPEGYSFSSSLFHLYAETEEEVGLA